MYSINLIKEFALMLVALAGVALLSPIVFVANIARKALLGHSIADYFHTIAVGLDQLGGSVIYAQEDWTISSYTYYLCRYKANRAACVFRGLIDLIFGRGHCERSYKKELHEFQSHTKDI